MGGTGGHRQVVRSRGGDAQLTESSVGLGARVLRKDLRHPCVVAENSMAALSAGPKQSFSPLAPPSERSFRFGESLGLLVPQGRRGWECPAQVKDSPRAEGPASHMGFQLQ